MAGGGLAGGWHHYYQWLQTPQSGARQPTQSLQRLPAATLGLRAAASVALSGEAAAVVVVLAVGGAYAKELRGV